MTLPSRLAAWSLVVILVGCGGGGTGRAAAPAPYAPPETAEPAPAGPVDTTGLLRVRFARGTTSGILNDSLSGDESRSYLLGALQGQVMLAHAIAWPAGEAAAATAATVRVFSALDGRELTAPSGPGSLWWSRLPGTGDYVVRVSADQPMAYTLSVQIPRRLSPRPGDPTARVAGTAPARAPVDYIVEGRSGQTLAASVGGGQATLHLYGLEDGTQLAPLSERRGEWAGTLPASQDYIVSVVPAAEGARYQLTVTLR